ncbi:MAG: NADPH2:quinone reductase [Paraglaciecola sp.]|jgi:NADPH2:quinone reductase
MQFIDYQEGGAADKLFINTTAKPILEHGQVLIKVEAFGINRADTLQRQGKYPPPRGESPILGLEVAGKVIAIGPNNDSNNPTVCRWQLDDKVFGLVAGGGYAEYVAVDAEHLLPVPKNMPMVEAAGIAEVFLTAYQSLFKVGKMQPQQRVLIHAGASGVGLAAIQLAKAAHCHVAVTASNKGKLDKCQQLGADLLINYQQQDFAEVINEQGAGYDVIIDFVAGDYLNRNLKVLNTDGHIVYLAMLAGRFADKLDMGLLLAKRATISGSTLRNRSKQYKQELIKQFSVRFYSSFELTQLVPAIDTVYPPEDISIAHQRLEDNDTMGKLIGRW